MILGVVGTGANIVFFAYTDVFACFCNFSDLFDSGSRFFGIVDNEMLTPVQFIGAFIILIECIYLLRKIKQLLIK
jgi:hypothetical protein